MKPAPFRSRPMLLGLVMLAYLAPAGGADEERWRTTRYGIDLSFAPRTPEQITAFYLARHLPAVAVEELAARCLVTVGIRNRSKSVVWLEPKLWRITTVDGDEVQRLDREYWGRRWQALGVAPGPAATFGWTQLPESRDLQPGEPVGGNIVIDPPAQAFTIEARFRTGADGTGTRRVMRSGPLRCRRDGAPS